MEIQRLWPVGVHRPRPRRTGAHGKEKVVMQKKAKGAMHGGIIDESHIMESLEPHRCVKRDFFFFKGGIMGKC